MSKRVCECKELSQRVKNIFLMLQQYASFQNCAPTFGRWCQSANAIKIIFDGVRVSSLTKKLQYLCPNLLVQLSQTLQ